MFQLSTRAPVVRLLVVPREAPGGVARGGVVVDGEGKRVTLDSCRDGTDAAQDAARALRGLHRGAGMIVQLTRREILSRGGLDGGIAREVGERRECATGVRRRLGGIYARGKKK